MKRPVFVSWLAAVAFALSWVILPGCASTRELPAVRTKIGPQGVTLPAQIIGNHFVVEIKGDKRGPWRFLVDTGSSVTLVSPEFARRYASEKAALETPTVRVHSADGNSTLLTAITVRQVSVGEARFENVQALIFDCAELSAHFGVKIDGVLGFPLFRDTLLTLDYPQSRLLLAPVEGGEQPLTSGGVTIKFNNNQRIPLIPVRLGGEIFISLIDSGSDGSLLLNPVGLHPHFISGPRPGTTVATLTGNRPQEIGRVDQSLGLGAYSFKNPIVDLTDQLSAIGGDVLRHFAVTFDQAKNQVTFRRDTTTPIVTPPRRSPGLSFSKTPVYWRVAGVVPGSPADAAGIQVGNLVTRINGEPVSGWNLQRWDALVKRATEVTFTFLDGTKENPRVIETFDLVP